MASYKQFGDAFQHPPHRAKTTLTQLKSIKSMCDPRNVKAFFATCEPNRLSGVVDPFWCNWPFSDPNLFLTPEALHHWHRKSYDHNGILMLKQVTRKAQQDIQHYLVAVITNAAPPGIVIAVCVLMDFHSLSQAVTIDGKQCQKILDALKTFHNHKHEVIAHSGHWGAKSKDILDNWYIPKLKLMQSVVPKQARITLIKDPAESTNNQNYDPQICQYLDHIEKCRHFHTATYIAQQLQSQMHAATAGYRDDLDDEINDDKNTDEAGDLQAAISDFWGTVISRTSGSGIPDLLH
ncbi:uncharacterized protein EDB91DRAFT_1252316 [Suillus paluster]|uniref:uncharacterized protein n=1 Tax=Suillus paluster TaxID=48578 RepID=UPI001B8807AE|nr:uncharacterized protein EDB91DRAFT_1252316 [Suillus paluster]KAG1731058.1 hypothetical protein EDB91DRAFT_1252316 [Suillus paluster]